jgi:hypothetical protein
MAIVSLDRHLPLGVHPLCEIASGLVDSPALRGLFPSREDLRSFLSDAKVDVREFEGYMWVDDSAGVVVVSREYLSSGPELELYLDFVHEVVHLKQFMEGRELFDESVPYVRRPTELEAYGVTVAEARRLGMAEDHLAEYLRVPWVSEDEHRELLETLGVV